MRKFLIIIITLLSIITIFAKDYYVGDLIKFNIESTKSEEEIKKAFKDFEIEKIEKSGNGYIVTARSFNTGKKIIEIEKSKIEFEIKSSVNSQNNKIAENIDEKERNFKNEKIGSFPFTVIFIILLTVFTTGLILLVIKLIRRKSKNPYIILKREVNNSKKGDYFKDATAALKRYIEKKSGIIILNKTTNESCKEMEMWILSEEEQKEFKEIMDIADRHKFMYEGFIEEDIKKHSEKIERFAAKLENRVKKAKNGVGK